ncbi:MAG: FHA domain-containing protein [Planctomycetes bacterium]|nr:FHA domain-containing protein [Planctomycetota bacterium]
MPEIGLELTGDFVGEKKNVKLSGNSFILGRSQSCAFSVLSDVASRQHTEIRFEKGKWIVADLGSSNGTFINDRRVEKAEVRVGDIVMLGKTGAQVRVVSLDPPPPPRNEDLESTVVVSGGQAKLPPAKAPARPVPPPPAQKAAAAAASTTKRGGKLGLFLFLLGAAFGVFTAEGQWDKEWCQKAIYKAGTTVKLVKIDKFENFQFQFPYKYVAVPPAHWLREGFKQAFRLQWARENLAGEKPWRYTLDVVFALYFGLFLFFLARPFRRWFWILLWAGGHAAMYLLLPKGMY